MDTNQKPDAIETVELSLCVVRVGETVSDEQEDCCFVPEYRKDILEYLKELEKKSRFESDYTERCTDYNGTHRRVLVDWMAEVTDRLNMYTDTFFLAVRMADLFLAKHRDIKKMELQVHG